MRKILSFFILLALPAVLWAKQPVHSRVKIYFDRQPIESLLKTGIEIQVIDRQGGYAKCELSEGELEAVKQAGFRCEVLIPDMEKYYSERSLASKSAAAGPLDGRWPVPANFSLGSCGGFSTISEMTAQLDLMHQLYPDLITIKKPISDTLKTIAKRPVYFVKISDNAAVKENEPEVLYTGMHHAREPIGMQHLLYFMWYLLENYQSDAEVKALVDNLELYFVPVFNVDGYQYNIDQSPQGGGMWRKNRRDSGNGNFGIDLNRNYGYSWGFDDTGSSGDPGSAVYRGTAPFSEPETRMMKYFCESHQFKFALNYHSYSNLCLYPWGYTPDLCPDDAIFRMYSVMMTRENNYTYGPASTTIYPTNGGSDDWMYGEQAIFAYTPEVGAEFDGFWPDQSRILPLIQENMLASMLAARLSGKSAVIADQSPYFIDKYTGFMHYSVKRTGLTDGNLNVKIIPLDDKITEYEAGHTISGLLPGQSAADSIRYTLSPGLVPGDTLRFLLALETGFTLNTDTLVHIFGAPVTLFEDKVDDATNWKGTWARTTSVYFSPSGSMTDSPAGPYAAYSSIVPTTLAGTVNIPDKPQVVLQFMAKWDIEKFYDYVQLTISTDNGATWTPLKGKYTVKGSWAQDPGSPVYDGLQDDWVREEISLNQYRGKNIKLRFTLYTTNDIQKDGFYFDDLNISWLPDYTAVKPAGKAGVSIGKPFPNPAAGAFSISCSMPPGSAQCRIVLFSADGKRLLTQAFTGNNGIQTVETASLKPGLYFVAAEYNGSLSGVQRVVVAWH